MKIRINQFSAPLDYTLPTLSDQLSRALNLPAEKIQNVTVTRRSVDARSRKGPVCFTLSVEFEITGAPRSQVEKKLRKIPSASLIEAVSKHKPAEDFKLTREISSRPVVVGAGPAGLFAAWQLAVAGAKPILIERGKASRDRAKAVAQFWKDGTLDAENNVLFGEGGAGLFSDGKLTTRSKLRESLRTVLELFVATGADSDILIDAEPHIGSDKLLQIVPRIRQQIIDLGGEVLFDTALESVEVKQGKLVAVIAAGKRIETSHCILATGHSARDIYKMLHRENVQLAPKPFAIGVRVELPQDQINYSQYRESASHPRLGAASFRLTRKADDTHRSCYSFCMCPGGEVIACAHSAGELTTNGMSLSSRKQSYGNAAFLVPVEPGDFASAENNPLAGIAFQEEFERKAFSAGGENFTLPACMVTDFLEGKISRQLPADRSAKRAQVANLREILPAFVTETLDKTLAIMLKKLGKVRIVRDEDFQSPTAAGLYPAGEGAGYAGGIVTTAIDGLRTARAVIENINSEK